MITPAEIRTKALKYWNNQRFLRAQLNGETLFPLIIPFPKLNSAELLQNFAFARKWIDALREGSKERKGFGYTVELSKVQHRQLGEQELPRRIVIESADNFLRLIEKKSEFQRFSQLVDLILSRQAQLRGWLERYPARVLEYRENWSRFLQVCDFFQAKPRPNRYLRELDIPGVDSKFVEQHQRVLADLLNEVLGPEAIVPDVVGLSRHGFERRFGLKYEEPLIRFRILDEELMDGLGLDDLSVPLSAFGRLSLRCDKVFITENKLNGLTFPKVKSAIVIFGLGYGIQSLQYIEWITKRRTYYWGDIDTHGFGILSQVRAYFPQTESFLMDRRTLLDNRHLWVPEPKDKRCLAELPNLRGEEIRLYQDLRDNVLGENVRLEQERVGFQQLQQSLCSLLV